MKERNTWNLIARTKIVVTAAEAPDNSISLFFGQTRFNLYVCWKLFPIVDKILDFQIWK